MINKGIYFITDSTGFEEKEFLNKLEGAMSGGISLLQLREKEKTTKEYIELASKVHKIARKYNVPLIIDDRADVAFAVDAEGVHLGQGDMPVSQARKLLGKNKIIGATAKTVEQAKKALVDGADYLGVGALYPTTTKVKTVITSVETLKEICNVVSIPVFAIGGLNADNMGILKGVGVSGVCAVSAIMKSVNPQKAVEELNKKFRSLFISSKLKTALTVAGSDCSGGAGIQADIKTMTANGVYAMSAITALTAQNTTGVLSVSEVSPEFLREQLDMIFSDIIPDAVKTGMVSSSELIEVIAERLKFYGAKNLVVDPVMVATSGADLMKNEALSTMKELLLPMASIITPNIPEAEILADIKIKNESDMIYAATKMNGKYGCAVLIKGGHCLSGANDLLCYNGKTEWFFGERIDNPNTHGTGCTLSSAIASNLAKGYDIKASVRMAKEYLTEALSAMLDLGKGSGPINHMSDLRHFI